MFWSLFWQLKQVRIWLVEFSPLQRLLVVCVHLLPVLSYPLFLSNQLRVFRYWAAQRVVQVRVLQERTPASWFVHGFVWFEPNWTFSLVYSGLVALIAMKWAQWLELVIFLNKSCELSFAFPEPCIVMVVLTVKRLQVSTLLHIFNIGMTGHDSLLLFHKQKSTSTLWRSTLRLHLGSIMDILWEGSLATLCY